uniref:Uncharacterized protein n=1 Tax=Arundo donax TaxID=35708 RepID=A0A0A9FN34_ARUDO
MVLFSSKDMSTGF